MKDEAFVYWSYEIDMLIDVANEKVAQVLADANHRYIVFTTTNEELNAYYGVE